MIMLFDSPIFSQLSHTGNAKYMLVSCLVFHYTYRHYCKLLRAKRKATNNINEPFPPSVFALFSALSVEFSRNGLGVISEHKLLHLLVTVCFTIHHYFVITLNSSLFCDNLDHTINKIHLLSHLPHSFVHSLVYQLLAVSSFFFFHL